MLNNYNVTLTSKLDVKNGKFALQLSFVAKIFQN